MYIESRKILCLLDLASCMVFLWICYSIFCGWMISQSQPKSFGIFQVEGLHQARLSLRFRLHCADQLLRRRGQDGEHGHAAARGQGAWRPRRDRCGLWRLQAVLHCEVRLLFGWGGSEVGYEEIELVGWVLCREFTNQIGDWGYFMMELCDRRTPSITLGAQPLLIQIYLQIQVMFYFLRPVSQVVAGSTAWGVPIFSSGNLYHRLGGFHRVTLAARNSWGEGWGDKGYFYMPYAYITDPQLAQDSGSRLDNRIVSIGVYRDPKMAPVEGAPRGITAEIHWFTTLPCGSLGLRSRLLFAWPPVSRIFNSMTRTFGLSTGLRASKTRRPRSEERWREGDQSVIISGAFCWSLANVFDRWPKSDQQTHITHIKLTCLFVCCHVVKTISRLLSMMPRIWCRALIWDPPSPSWT